MGWEGIYIEKNEIKDHLRKLWDKDKLDNGEKRFEIVQHIVYGNIHHQAVRDNKDDCVFAVTILTSYENNELIYKMIDETNGCYAMGGINAKFLNSLTETDNEIALGWRKRAWDHIEREKFFKKHLVSGAKIELNNTLDYGPEYGEVSNFKLFKIKNNSYVSLSDGQFGRLPRNWKDSIVSINGEKVPA